VGSGRERGRKVDLYIDRTRASSSEGGDNVVRAGKKKKKKGCHSRERKINGKKGSSPTRQLIERSITSPFSTARERRLILCTERKRQVYEKGGGITWRRGETIEFIRSKKRSRKRGEKKKYSRT